MDLNGSSEQTASCCPVSGDVKMKMKKKMVGLFTFNPTFEVQDI
jgi:hypothetical protein